MVKVMTPAATKRQQVAPAARVAVVGLRWAVRPTLTPMAAPLGAVVGAVARAVAAAPQEERAAQQPAQEELVLQQKQAAPMEQQAEEELVLQQEQQEAELVLQQEQQAEEELAVQGLQQGSANLRARAGPVPAHQAAGLTQPEQAAPEALVGVEAEARVGAVVAAGSRSRPCRTLERNLHRPQSTTLHRCAAAPLHRCAAASFGRTAASVSAAALSTARSKGDRAS